MALCLLSWHFFFFYLALLLVLLLLLLALCSSSSPSSIHSSNPFNSAKKNFDTAYYSVIHHKIFTCKMCLSVCEFNGVLHSVAESKCKLLHCEEGISVYVFFSHAIGIVKSCKFIDAKNEDKHTKRN